MSFSPLAYERGEYLYLVAPVTPHVPSPQEIEEYAFGKSVIEDLRRIAPNEHISWFGGQYVEGDRPNLNGAMWLSEDLAIASLTPMMMPVTVMHDPRTAVGVIGHVGLKTEGAPRAKIETALALWKHRFPDVVAEAEANYAQGTLMQSMECLAPSYDCSVCGMHFVKLPKGAEQENWCDHLRTSRPSAGYSASASAENANASRILRGVTFTGTGLIFGTRGGTGADPEAHLESFQEELAEFHQNQHNTSTSPKPKPKPRSTRKMDEITIPKSEYDELRSRPSGSDLDQLRERAETAERKAEEAEAAKVAAEAKAQEAVEAKEAVAAEKAKLEEKANRQTLRDERWEALGTAFTEKLDSMPTTKANLLRDAEEMEEEAWSTRLAEVEESTQVKRDAAKDANEESDEAKAKKGEKGEIFEREEVARFGGGTPSGGGIATLSREQSPGERRAVVAGLTKKPKSDKKS